MLNELSQPAPPRGRTLIHPGPFNPVRIQSKRAARAQHIRLTLKLGKSLFQGLTEPLISRGIYSASTTILGGEFEELEFCVAPPDPLKQAVIAYTKPVSTGCTYMVFGNATLGKTVKGEPLVHCHAVIRTALGAIKGGHIITQSSIVGSQPIVVLVTVLEGFELRSTYDPETNIPLMQPQDEGSHV